MANGKPKKSSRSNRSKQIRRAFERLIPGKKPLKDPGRPSRRRAERGLAGRDAGLLSRNALIPDRESDFDYLTDDPIVKEVIDLCIAEASKSGRLSRSFVADCVGISLKELHSIFANNREVFANHDISC